MVGGSRGRSSSGFTGFASVFICGICGRSAVLMAALLFAAPASAGEYVYVEVFCNNPVEVRADAPRPDPNAPKLLSDPEKPPLVCRYFSNVVFAGRFRPREFAGDGPAPQEQVQESAAITKAAGEAFDIHVRRPCKYKQVKIGGAYDTREEAEKSRDLWLRSYSSGADGCADAFSFMY